MSRPRKAGKDEQGYSYKSVRCSKISKAIRVIWGESEEALEAFLKGAEDEPQISEARALARELKTVRWLRLELVKRLGLPKE